MRVGADLTFEVSAPGRDTVHGNLSGSGNRLLLEIDDPSLFAGTRSSGAGRSIAETMSSHGISVRVVSRGVHVVTAGAVMAPWWQRLATGSSRIRLGSPRGAWMARSALRSDAESLLPDLSGVPLTPFPIAPTFGRLRRLAIATTHDLGRGGLARLFLLPGARSREGQEQRAFTLLDPLTVVGSAESCDIVLAGLEGRHAEIHQDENDEFILVGAEGADVRVNGRRGARLLLRTGSRVEIGPWTLAFTRQEHADHGRPHGGRSGGETGYQRPQRRRNEGGAT